MRIYRTNIYTGEKEWAEVKPFRKVIRAAGGDNRSVSTKTYQEHKPLQSITLGCHSSQIKEFNDRIKKDGRRGVRYVPHPRGIEYGGVAEFTSRRGRNEEMKKRNKMDGDAGYGDWAGSGSGNENHF
jgi:hypothetical protein